MSKKYAVLAAFVVLLSLTLSSCFLIDFFKTDLDRAIDTVKVSVLPQLLAQTPNASYICVRTESIVASGTIIMPDAGQTGQGNVDSIVVERMVARGDSYFFMLDLEPGAFYAHPVKYILAPKSGASPTIMSAEWLPRIGGVIPQELKNKIPSSNLIVQSNVNITTSSGTLLVYDNFVSLIVRETEGIIVVEGLMPDENLFNETQNSYLQVINFFLAYKAARSYGTVDVNGLVQSDANKILTAIDSMASSHSVVTIYILSHGNIDYVRLGGVGFSASQFKNVMAAHPSTKFNFFLGSCHGGSFVNDLGSLENVRLILTAAKSNESAWPDWDTYGSSTDYNSYDLGSEWTSSLFERAKSILESSAKWQLVSNYASAYKIPTISALFYQAHWGVLGANSAYGFTSNLDLCNRVGKETPQVYKSW